MAELRRWALTMPEGLRLSTAEEQRAQAAYVRSTRAVTAICAPSGFLLLSGLLSLIPAVKELWMPAYISGMFAAFFACIGLGIASMIVIAVLDWIREAS